MKQKTVSVHITTWKQLNSSRFTSELIVLLLSGHRINSVVCSFPQLPGCWSYEEEINCEYALLCRQSMMCFSSPVYCNLPPAYQLSVVLHTHINPRSSTFYSALESILPRKFFHGKISISSWISYAIILMSYYKRCLKKNSN